MERQFQLAEKQDSDSRRSNRSDSDSSSEDDRYRSRSRDSSRSRSGSRGRAIKNCTYCHKPNHDWSHCYKYQFEIAFSTTVSDEQDLLLSE